MVGAAVRGGSGGGETDPTQNPCTVYERGIKCDTYENSQFFFAGCISVFSPYGVSSIVMYIPCVTAAHRVAGLYESTPVEILNVSNCHAKDIRLLPCYTEFSVSLGNTYRLHFLGDRVIKFTFPPKRL